LSESKKDYKKNSDKHISLNNPVICISGLSNDKKIIYLKKYSEVIYLKKPSEEEIIDIIDTIYNIHDKYIIII
jgi:hypothetical protein